MYKLYECVSNRNYHLCHRLFIFKPLKITKRKGKEKMYFPPIAKSVAKIKEK